MMPTKRHETLGFDYGAELPDPKSIMEGSRILNQHLKARSLEDLNKPDLIALLKFSTSYRVPAFHSN